MKLFSKFFSSVGQRVFGATVADYGELPSKADGWVVSISLRKRQGQRPYLLLKSVHGRPPTTNTQWVSLASTPEVYERLEQIIKDARRDTEQNADQGG